MTRRTEVRRLLAAALGAMIVGCGDAEAPTSLPAEGSIDPEAVIVRAEAFEGRVRISIASAKARPTALLLTVSWDAQRAVVRSEFTAPEGSETIVAADAGTPGRLRIAAVGLGAEQSHEFHQVLGEFELEPNTGSGRLAVTMDVEQVLENEERVATARVVVVPLSISLNR